jgi:pantetheine-phosphate adenylyltransferase
MPDGEINYTIDTYRQRLQYLLNIYCKQSLSASESYSQNIIERWQEPHRVYHTLKHLSYIIKSIDNYLNEFKLSKEEEAILILAAFYHDSVYEPNSNNNEMYSVLLFQEHTKNIHEQSSQKLTKIITDVKQIIHETSLNDKPTTKLSKLFRKFDEGFIYEASFEELLNYENQIFEEFQFAFYSDYKIARMKVLNKLILHSPTKNHHLIELVQYVKYRKINIGIYPGSFNPFHIGHLAILKKAEQIFDKVIIAVGYNPTKKDTTEKVLHNLQNLQCTKYHEIIKIDKMLTDFIRDNQSDDCNITIVKGLRSGTDLENEISQLRYMNDMLPNVKIVYIPCKNGYQHISSSAIRQLQTFNSQTANRYLPK